MSTHNICFYQEIRKNIMWIPLLICSWAHVGALSHLLLVLLKMVPHHAHKSLSVYVRTVNLCSLIKAFSSNQ